MPHYWLCIKIKWTHCSETDTQERSSVHVPHHSCNAAGKFLVHDCAAVFGGTSLHENLLEGPDLTSTLLGVLLRFRQGKIAFTSGIKSMFFQVKVDPRDCDSLARFFVVAV